MRTFFGMILGAMLTVGIAFIYDTRSARPSTGPSTTGSASNVAEHRQTVNWDVVGDIVRIMSRRAQGAWTTLAHNVMS